MDFCIAHGRLDARCPGGGGARRAVVARVIGLVVVALASGDTPAARAQGAGLPAPMVYLRDIDATIPQDIRYASDNNFTGRRVPGYDAAECILLEPVARALAAVQREIATQGLSLKVYDCYRPARAVQALVTWAGNGRDDQAARRHHPRIERVALLAQGYLARTSDHSRGTAVDVTLVRSDASTPAGDQVVTVLGPGSPAGNCIADAAERTPDTSLDMGTGYDCFDRRSHIATREITPRQREARQALLRAMARGGFAVYAREWWHFTHPSRPAGGRRFDFPIPPYRRGG